MKHLIYFVIICLLAISCKQSSTSNDDVDTNHLDLSFVQNGETLKPINGTITLDKHPFNLVFEFPKQHFILVNASFKNDLMFKALNKETLTTQPQFILGNIIAETYFNTENSIYASSESSSAWLQESLDKHMFNNLEIKDGTYTGTRIVEHIFDQDRNQNIAIKNINAPLYLVFVVIAINDDLKDNVELQRIMVKIEWTGNTSIIEETPEETSFNSVVSDLRVRHLPVIDSTNFDSIIEAPYFFNAQEVELLQLEKIYSNYYEEGYDYRTTPSYRIALSEDYYTMVFTSYIDDHEMESVLVNYTLDGVLRDYNIISYDEIAESLTRVISKIDAHSITTTTTTWIEDKKEDTQRFQIDDHGIISQISLNDLTDIALAYLNINENEVVFDFFSLVEISETKTVIFIPKIAKESDDVLLIDAYLLIVNPKTGEIQSKFIEKKCWYSDALQITNIEVNYNPYRITENSETVGITVDYYGSSRVNPFVSKELTLFIRDGEALERVLKDYEIYNRTGENDGDGNGFYNENSRTIMIDETSGNRFYNLKITDSIKEVEFENRNDKTINKYVNFGELMYQNGTYKKDSIN